MVRNYISRAEKRKKYAKHDSEKISQALQKLATKGQTMSKVAREFDMQISSLSYYVQKFKDKDVQDGIQREPKNRVFSDELEKELLTYIREACDNYAGLDSRQIRLLAYDLAIENKLAIPQNWSDKKIAGIDWLYCYVKRHSTLSLRKPQLTTQASNKKNLASFFSNLQDLMLKYNFEDKDIYTMDECGIATSCIPNRVYNCKGQKQISALISRQRGELVTFSATVSAIGNSIPPFFIFPRARYSEDIIAKAPQGSAGAANKNSWMTREIFLEYLKHFVKHTKCSVHSPCLLLLDNHVSHISLHNIKFAKANGIIILTFPPHSANILQPLERSIFEPFKNMLNKAALNWINSNPEKSITIQIIPELVAMNYSKVFSSKNIQSGFKFCGIYPFNNNIFSEQNCEISDIVHISSCTSNENSNDVIIVDEVDEEIDCVSIEDAASILLLDNYVLPSNIMRILKANTFEPVKQTTGKHRNQTTILSDSEEVVNLKEHKTTNAKKLVKRIHNTISKKKNMKEVNKKIIKKKAVKRKTKIVENEIVKRKVTLKALQA